MSLRLRLSLIACLLFLLGMLAGSSFLISAARQRVNDEVASSVTLANQLLGSLVNISETGATLDADILGELLPRLENSRHIAVSIEPENDRRDTTVSPGDSLNAPGWFTRRVLPAPLAFRIPLSDAANVLVIRSNATDEVNEVWLETRTFLLALLVVLLLLVSILFIVVGRWFRPVSTIVGGLEAMEKGDYSTPLEVTALPELNIIADKLNQLQRVLKDSREENARLASRALSIQEEERRRLARELHDELGQSVSAVKAIAFSIASRVEDLDAKSAEGANKIGAISENVRDRIRHMMRQLRPTVLDELGLLPALEQMVDDWNDNHEDCFCRFTAMIEPTRLGQPEISINVYRIVQESLTNIARHAGAGEVEITLAETGQDMTLVIADNGCGFDPACVTPGMGLGNIRERARALGGELGLQASPGQGVVIRVVFPSRICHSEETMT